MGVVAVIGVVGVVYEQPGRGADGAWVLVLGGRIGSWRTPPRPLGPSHTLRPHLAISELASQPYLRGKTRLIHISKARECVPRKRASFTCVDSNMSAAKNIVKALEPFTR